MRRESHPITVPNAVSLASFNRKGIAQPNRSRSRQTLDSTPATHPICGQIGYIPVAEVTRLWTPDLRLTASGNALR